MGKHINFKSETNQPRNEILHCRCTSKTLKAIENIRKAADLKSTADAVEFMALQGEPQALDHMAHQEHTPKPDTIQYNKTVKDFLQMWSDERVVKEFKRCYETLFIKKDAKHMMGATGAMYIELVRELSHRHIADQVIDIYPKP